MRELTGMIAERNGDVGYVSRSIHERDAETEDGVNAEVWEPMSVEQIFGP